MPSVAFILADYERQGNQMTRDEEIINLIKSGKTYLEIAKEYGMSKQNVGKIAKKYGVKPVTVGNGINNEWHHIESQRKMVEDGTGRFEYISSRKLEHNQQIKVRCKCCGLEQIRNASGIRRRGVGTCPACNKREQAEKERMRFVYVLKALAETKVDKTCPYCGKIFHSQYQTKKYCSSKCRDKAHQAKRASEGKKVGAKYRKRAQRYGCAYEKGITRFKVVERDNYICGICGKVCNPNDKRWGTFGPDYPTLDHIIPLAKGGSHSWDNVQCACGECNSYKRDLII